MGIIESKFIKRTTILSLALFALVSCAPLVAQATGLEQAEQIAKMSESNPYQALVYALASISICSMAALGYVYKQNISSVKEQYGILQNLSDNIKNQTATIQKNQEIMSKSLDVVNDKLGQKPCLLDSDLLKELLKNRK